MHILPTLSCVYFTRVPRATLHVLTKIQVLNWRKGIILGSCGDSRKKKKTNFRSSHELLRKGSPIRRNYSFYFGDTKISVCFLYPQFNNSYLNRSHTGQRCIPAWVLLYQNFDLISFNQKIKSRKKKPKKVRIQRSKVKGGY
jgi:hypothetical protein